MKKCGRCETLKPLVDFGRNKTKPDKKQHFCKSCNTLYQKEWYRVNKKAHIKTATLNRKKAADLAAGKATKYLLLHPCVDCGEKRPQVLEFDHLPQFKKSVEISRLISNGYSFDTILKEIEKCEVRCRNCHKIVTDRRRDKTAGWRALAIESIDGIENKIKYIDLYIESLEMKNDTPS